MKEIYISLLNILSFSFQPMKGEWVVKEKST